jgi:predicted metalloprotease with PDZ domain
MERTAERLTISNFRDFFADHVTGTRPLDFEAALGVVGLELVHEPTKSEDDKKDESKKEESPPKQRAYIGLRLSTQDGLASVSTAIADGPAYKAGIIAGDLIVSMNGQRIRSTADLDAQLKLIKPGDTVTLAYFRYDRLHEVEFKADGRLDGKWTVRRVKTPTDEQKAVYESWLGQMWPESKKTEPAAETKGTEP